ncbi:MAG: MarR family winged helix-turn-helix transcriptional regulator, partial [Actinocrinis sp.]
ILAALRSAPDRSLRMTDLADRLVYSRSGLTYQVTLLVKAGYLVRTPSRDDERSVIVTATRAGLNVLEKVFDGHVEVVRQALFAPLDAADVDALGDILGRVRDHQQTFPPRSAAPRAAARRSTDENDADD